jgi:ribosomal protein L11 methyltransferase
MGMRTPRPAATFPGVAPAWTEILVLAPVEWQELVAETLAVGPCSSVAFGPPSLGTDAAPEGWDYVRTYVIEGEDTPELRARVAGSLAALARAVGAGELADLAPRFRRLPAEDYANSWRKSWKPFRVAGFAIVPRDWRGRTRESDVRMWLEPGGAFGTGRHSTTRGCLRVIEERIRGGESVLDAGCGNGVLAVAGVLRGAGRALGFDLDPSAIPYARELAEWNGVAGSCEFRAGGFDRLGASDTDFDAVLANIYADLIQAHAGELAARLRPGGWFAFSGCVRDKRDATVAAIGRAGLAIDEIATRGRWDTFRGRRRR